MKNQSLFQRWPFWTIFVFALFIVISRIVLVPLNDEKGGRRPWRGDAYSEIGSISAAYYWFDFSHAKTYFRPMYNYYGFDHKQHTAEEATVYLHYPPFSELTTSLSAHILNTKNVQLIRVLPTVFSFLFLFFFIYALRKMDINDDRILWLSGFYLLSNYFLAFADTLYIHSSSEVFKFVYIFLLYRHYHLKQHWTKLLPLSVGCLVLGQISPTFTVFCAVFTVSMSIAFQKSWMKILAPENIILGLGFIGGGAIHLTLNTLYLGSWEACVQDLEAIFKFRGSLEWSKKIKLPLMALNRVERMYLVSGFAMPIFHFFYYREFEKNQFMKGLSWSLLIAGLAWYPIMAQHAYVHTYIAREIGWYIILVGGLGSLAYIKYLKSNFQTMTVVKKTGQVLFVAYCLAMLFTQQIAEIWWAHGIGRWF